MSIERPRHKPGVAVGELNRGLETAVFDPVSKRVVSLNTTAAAIWYLCDGTRDVPAIAQQVAAAHPDVNAASVEADVRDIVERLSELGLLL